jgi:hypothetical protein
MGLVGIKVREGGYVGFDRDGRARGRPTPYLFDMRPCEGGFTFRALGCEVRLGLSVDGSALVASETTGTSEVFALALEDERWISMRTAGGRPVTVDADGRLGVGGAADVPARFHLEPLDLIDDIETAATGVHGRCCHVGGEMALWARDTHEQIVTLGIETLLGEHRSRAWVKAFFDELWSLDGFRKTLLSGLEDADGKPPYNQGIFLWHFYDPDSGETFLPGNYFNARTAGTYYCYLSAAAASEIREHRRTGRPVPETLMHTCAYNLGLSLHFLTDLTQPMHAANFTNVSLPVAAHHAFEKFVDDHRERIFRKITRLSPGNLDDLERSVINGEFQPSARLHAVAAESKLVWRNKLWPWIDAGNRNFERDDPETIEAVLDASTRRAPFQVASFVFSYMGLILSNQNVVDVTKWYKIKEHTRGELMSAKTQGYQLIERWPPFEPELADRQIFCFVPDHAGTYRIVCKRNIDSCWRMYTHGLYLRAQLMREEDPYYNAFFIEHAGVHGGSRRVRIHEPTKEELVTIDWGLLDNGRSLRWEPRETEEERLTRQTYELIPVGDIGEAEHARITAIWEKKIRARA